MSGFDRMKTRLSAHGKNMRDMKIRDAIHIADLEFQNDPSYCDCMFRWVPGENPHSDGLFPIRLYDRKYSAANGNRVSFHVRIDSDIHIEIICIKKIQNSIGFVQSYTMKMKFICEAY
ncbi:MAG: hypothetical protein ACLUUO_05490 [Sellimonas intestinalis]